MTTTLQLFSLRDGLKQQSPSAMVATVIGRHESFIGRYIWQQEEHENKVQQPDRISGFASKGVGL